MSKRITVVSMFEKETINHIQSLINDIEAPMCKVPYGIDDDNREKIDTLPFHLTIYACEKEYEHDILDILNNLRYKKIKVLVNEVKLIEIKNNANLLYLAIEESEDIKNLQRIFYNKLPSKKYNPDKFVFHITLNIGKDYNQSKQMQEIINKNFKPFEIEFSKLGLFDYPGDQLKEIEL